MPKNVEATFGNLLAAFSAEPDPARSSDERVDFDSVFIDSDPISRNDVPPAAAGGCGCLIDPDDVRRVPLGTSRLYVSRGPFEALVQWRIGARGWIGSACTGFGALPAQDRLRGYLPLQRESGIAVLIVERGYTDALIGDRWVAVRKDGLLIFDPRKDGGLTTLRGPRGTREVRSF